MKNKYILFKALEIMIPALFGVAILILLPYQVDVFSSFMLEESTRPQMFPKLLSWIMIIISIVQLIEFIAKKDFKNDEPVEKIYNTRLFLGLGLLIGYALLIPTIGFILSTGLCLLGAIYLLGNVVWYKALLYTSILSILIWFVFSQLLSIPLPTGWMG